MDWSPFDYSNHSTDSMQCCKPWWCLFAMNVWGINRLLPQKILLRFLFAWYSPGSQMKASFVQQGMSTQYWVRQQILEGGSRIGLSINRVNKNRYQGWLCQFGAISTAWLLSSVWLDTWKFDKMWGWGGGNMYRIPWSFHGIWKASVRRVNGSGFQLAYCGSWEFSRFAKRSIWKGPHFWFKAWKTSVFNFQSLLSWKYLNCQSASTFNLPGKYSAVKWIFLSRQ